MSDTVSPNVHVTAPLFDLAAVLAAAGRSIGLNQPDGAGVSWPDNARAALLASFAHTRPSATAVAVVPTESQARVLVDDLRNFLGDDVMHFPAWETLPFERMSPDIATMGNRMAVLARLRDERPPRIVVASGRAVMQQLAPGIAEVTPITVRRGDVVDPDTLARTLVEWGYRREPLCEHRGEFSRRGAILDVFDATSDTPVRIEWWGDEVERVSEFGVDDQRSTADLAVATFVPAREFIVTPAVRARAEQLIGEQPWGREHWERLANADAFDGIENWTPWFTDGATIVSVLPPRAVFVVCDPQYLDNRATEVLDEEIALAEGLATTWDRTDANSFPRLHVPLDAILGDARVALALTIASPAMEIDASASVRTSRWGSAPATIEDFAARLIDAAQRGHRVVLCCDSAESSARFTGQLAEHGVAPRSLSTAASLDAPGTYVAVAPLHDGCVFPDQTLWIIAESEVVGRKSARRRRSKRREAALSFEDLNVGGHVVHEVHGIGVYEGMVRQAVDGIERDYLRLRYANGNIYVLSDQVNAIRPYVGGDSPTLNRMGGADFERVKQRVRSELRLVAQELVVLYQRRLHAAGHAFSPDTPWQAELESAFEFVETNDQLRAIEEIKRDMERPVPMDRLVCGDVGFGKTEVALRAAFKCMQDGKQVAVLVPTTLLASQHFTTFSERFARFPVRVEVLSRFVPAAQARKVLAGLANGDVDCVIGTHRLLQDGVKFRDLGLLVVDEEQRFGVQHKEAMKMLRSNVDVLTLSATPIPRTLEMSLVGIRDMSLLHTPPADRQPIRTFVTGYDRRVAAEAIRRELLRQGQVFWVHNTVASIEERAEELRVLVPEARITVAHGQMDEATLERTVVDFWEGKFDVLVCTTIIESGIDMPAVNTLVVEDAHRLGLGQLHQLRGRVGRGGQQAYAYLFHPRDLVLREVAYERLRTIGEATELGSGFKIARRDLELRGAGSLLGEQQSGRIAAVGYDLYCQLVSEAVDEMKGEDLPPLVDVKIEIPTRAFLPDTYIDAEELRLDGYRRVAQVRTMADVEALRAEWSDRFGPPPPEALALLDIGALRARCVERGITHVAVVDKRIRISPVTLPASRKMRAERLFPGAHCEAEDKTVTVPLVDATPPAHVLLRLLDELFDSDD
ncbi:MAG: transcription-repair coupling factor [Ilumatobacteraceae bacterium]